MHLIIIFVLTIIVVCATVKAKSLESFIINGEDISTARFYAYLEIFRKSNFDGAATYFGGGTLISSTRVLTVAQNVDGFHSWRIGLGANQISNMEWFYSRESFIHPGYNKSSLADNVALIRVNHVTPNNAIRIAIVSNQGAPNPREHQLVRMVGFGFGSTNKQPKLLQMTQVKVTTFAECEFYYPHLHRTGQIINYFCAQNEINNSNMCAGDQGGPVYNVINALLIGIQSFYRIDNCSLPESQPPAFIRVAQYHDWMFSDVDWQTY